MWDYENKHYFDYAATTPPPHLGQYRLRDSVAVDWENPSAQYATAEKASKTLAEQRGRIAQFMGICAGELYFTSGGTESNNWAIFRGAELGKRYGKHLICSSLDHSSVVECFKVLQGQGYEVSFLQPDKTGQITLDSVLEALREDTVFLSLMRVNNETGIVTDVSKIALAVKEKNPHVLVHSDCVQALHKVELDLKGIDLASFSAHKVYGPKGLGGLFIRQGVKLKPLLYGGGQEQGLRSGTEATQQIRAWALALDYLKDGLDLPTAQERLRDNAHSLQTQLARVEGLTFPISQDVPRVPHILPISLVGYPSEVVQRFLSERNICVSSGSACHRGGKSHVYEKLNLNKKEKTGILRLSLSFMTTDQDISALCQGLVQARDSLCPML